MAICEVCDIEFKEGIGIDVEICDECMTDIDDELKEEMEGEMIWK